MAENQKAPVLLPLWCMLGFAWVSSWFTDSSIDPLVFAFIGQLAGFYFLHFVTYNNKVTISITKKEWWTGEEGEK